MILAVHEAGHAMMAALGPFRRVRRITLSPRADLAGNQASMETRIRHGFGMFHVQLGTRDLTWAGPDWFQGAIFLGGPLAEITFAPRAPDAKMGRFAASIFLSGLGLKEELGVYNELAWLDDLKPFIRRRELALAAGPKVRDNARDLEKAVREKLALPEVGKALQAVARELVEKETMDGRTFYAIISDFLEKGSFFSPDQAQGG